MIAAAKRPNMSKALQAALNAYSLQMGLPDGTHVQSIRNACGLLT